MTDPVPQPDNGDPQTDTEGHKTPKPENTASDPYPGPVEITDEQLLENFKTANQISYRLSNVPKLLQLLRLIHDNSCLFTWMVNTYQANVEPKPDYNTAYWTEFIDFMFPVTSQDRVNFEIHWHTKYKALLEGAKQQILDQSVQWEGKRVGLYLPDNESKKLIIPGQ